MARARHIGKIIIRAVEGAAPCDEPYRLRDNATYLITGGLGGLGLKVARWMADHGARHLALAGRSGPSQAARLILKRLEDEGVRVIVVSADVAQTEDVAALLAKLDAAAPPLQGIIHAAGVLDDGYLGQQSRERFDRVMAAKAYGAWNLHALTKDLPLEMFVMFSSTASVFGSPGQGNYAAANAFLDALAHHRHWEGKPALTINWGPWSEVGMAATTRDVVARYWEALGVGWIDPTGGLTLLEQLLSSGVQRAAVVPIDWSKFLQSLPSDSVPPFLTEVVRQTGFCESPTGNASDLLERLEQAEPGDRQEILLAEIRQLVAVVLGNDLSNLPDPHRQLNELGFDSLMAVELCSTVGRAINKHLAPTMLFDYPTLDALSTYLANDVLCFEPEAGSDTLDPPGTLAPGDGENENLRNETLAQVEGLCDEDMESLIAEEIAKLDEQ